MNDFNLHLEGTNVLSESVLNGVDSSNLIANVTTQSYTATQDCIVLCTVKSAYQTITLKLNNVQIFDVGSAAASSGSILYPHTILLKKGDTLTFTFSAATQSTHFRAFGLKR